MRDSILKLVSDDEIARVSTAETTPHLEGNEKPPSTSARSSGVCGAGPWGACSRGGP